MDWAIFRPKIATDYKRQCSEFSKPVNEAIVRTYQTKANDINLIFRGNYKLNFNQRMLDQDLILLLSCLQNYKENIQHIDLSFNEITNVGVQELSKFLQGTKSLQILQGCNSLESLNLQSNKIGVEGGELIAEGIKDIQTLTHLNLNFNNLQTKGAMSIVEMLFNNKTILELNLANNGIDHDGVIAITSILNWKNNTLQILNLDNPVYHSIGQETAIHFGKMFHSNRGLEKISLQKHNFTCDAIYIITEHLLENNKLRVLDLTANRISFKGCEAIAKYLCGEYCVLESLILTSNRTGHYGAKAIAQALSKNRTLIHLDMVRNDIDDNGLKMIAESLETNDMLVSLKLYQNHFSQMALQAFHKYRMKNNKKQAERFWDFHTYIVDNHIEMAYVEQNIPYDIQVSSQYFIN